MHEIFIQTEEQRAILDTVSRFVDDEIRPRSPELDANQDPEKSFSSEIIEAADRLGLRTMTLSEDYDGLGTDSLTTAMVVEEVAKGDLGISVVLAQTLKLAQIMEKALNDEQKERILPKFVADPRCCLAIGITEPDNASNLDTIGWIYFKLNNMEKAQSFIEASVKIIDNNAIVLEHLGDILMKNNKYADAKDLYKRALALDKDNLRLKEKVSLE